MILYLVYFVMLLGSALLILRIIWLQLLFQPQPEIAARLTPSTTVRTIEPERGRILDCDGRLLAISCPEYQFYMDCTVLKDSNTPEEEKVWMDKARELSKGLAREFPGTTADQFYNDNPEAGEMYRKFGILALEMEAAGLYWTAQRLGKRALAILTISDHIFTGEALNAQERQDSFHEMMEIALELAE